MPRMGSHQFERLYQAHAQPLYGFLVYRTGNPALAEDLVADTFERVLRSQWRFDRRRASEKTWIYSIALNLLRDQIRRAGASSRALERVAVAAASESSTTPFDAIENRELLQQAMEVLSSEEREAVALRFGADLSGPDIAGLLNEKLSTVEGRIYRALRKLKEALP